LYQGRGLVLFAGGLSFSMGAAINGGCSLSAVQQLADGNSRVLVTVLSLWVVNW
jgi:uncharacterized membrane protein YedE/YeeE